MTDLHVVDEGSGPSVVLLHGIGGSSRSFDPQVAELAENHRLLAWDAPGYGRSADVANPLSMDDYADRVASLIEDRCGEQGAHVLGMSWGGVIATRLALRRPDLVRSLILGSSTVGSGATPESAGSMLARAADVEADLAAFVADRARRLLASDADGTTVAAVAEEMAAAIRPAGYRSAAEAMAATDHTDRLPEVDVPTLVVAGDCDEVTGHAASQVLAGGIPGAVYVTLRGAGHLANRDRPEAFNAWAESFIQITERLRAQ
ncbi:alpha/beta fold hydrolase [Gordonia sp. PDNC005]|uniref:alpha/beta fold hydrolase n=1 Tax=unclassified Gordonia (in: high G+C Gram-positive bacteria) TaxID=2657482 RepID=UPI0019641882|nr:alpha/beta fold hydrolase [Gordonia sp. PDNC005]QRY62204.1 alpha/beta fold hydrolase [Gordonia sp. PDNC005]